MICDIMPTLSEDGDITGDGSMEDNNFEQLMVNMLDERDKLMETLRDTQDQFTNTKSSLKETELERDTLLRQFDLVLSKCELDQNLLLRKLTSFDSNDDDDSVVARLKQLKVPLSEEFVGLAKELYQVKEKLNERNEEIAELKAERSNTKLLLEHLESLVSRHERSLRMTVVKRQAQSSAGVSSEVEVLKALKSLFEHHKALDEKVRERLRMAVEKANSLEEELASANLEIEHLQYDLKTYQNRKSYGASLDVTSNGPVGGTESELQAEVNELRNRLEQKQKEIDKIRKESKDAKDRFNGLEEQIIQTTKKANHSLENNHKMQRELEEAIAQRNDAEERIMTLEKRFVRSQNELSSSSEEVEKLKAETMSMRNMLSQRDEKINNLQEQCKFYEMKCSQTLKNAEELPKIQEELESRKAALNAAEERNFTAEEQLQNLQVQLEDLSSDLKKTKDREKITENHNLKLQSTIDKLLSESNDRLQKHLKERMQTLDEKTVLSQELDRFRTEGDELKREKTQMKNEIEKLKSEVHLFQKQAQLNKSFSQTYNVDSSSTDGQTEQPWQTINQANVVSNMAKSLSHPDDPSQLNKPITTGLNQTPPTIITEENLETLTSNDAQKLANVLQQQLDAINQELALLQVEHRTTERLTEQIQKRVGSETSSLDNMSIGSSKSSEKAEDLRKRAAGNNEPHPLPKPLMRRDSDETNSSFLFSSYDPLDTKPMMLKVGRSQENLEEIDTPSSQPSDSSEGSDKSKFSIPWNLSSVYDSDNNSTYLEYDLNTSSLGTSMESLSRRAKNRGLKNSLGKIFSTKGKLKPRDFGFSRSEDLDSNAETQRDAELRMKKKLLEDVIASGAPFATWNAPTILAWLELWVKLPEWYIQACRANVKSGSIMSALSDYEIQHEIGVNNPLHRLKLRLSIHEMVNVTSPISPPSTKTALVFGDMNHFWIASEWLAALGLPQYRYSFIENLVDARMLEHITKKDYTKYLKVVDGFHRSSLSCGTKCLQMLNYDRKYLEKRRHEAETAEKDVLVWSNARVIKWVNKIGLEDYSDYLRQSGVNGAVIALEETFDIDLFCYYMQIPSTNEKARNTLEREYNRLLALCNEHKSISPTHSDLGDGDFKRSKSWRKKFKKEKPSLKERIRKDDNVAFKRTELDSPSSQYSASPSGNGDIMSPTRRSKRSPMLDRKPFNITRSGPS